MNRDKQKRSLYYSLPVLFIPVNFFLLSNQRNSLFKILPVAVIGRVSRNSTMRGYL